MVDKSADDFTAIGKICLMRATLEAERRYCGNDQEVLSGADVLVSERELLALLLDPRTVNSLQKLTLSEARTEGLQKLRDLYVSYAKTAFDYEQDQLQKHAQSAQTQPVGFVKTYWRVKLFKYAR